MSDGQMDVKPAEVIQLTEMLEAVHSAVQRGQWVVLVGSIVNGQVVHHAITYNFPINDLATVGELARNAIVDLLKKSQS